LVAFEGIVARAVDAQIQIGPARPGLHLRRPSRQGSRREPRACSRSA